MRNKLHLAPSSLIAILLCLLSAPGAMAQGVRINPGFSVYQAIAYENALRLDAYQNALRLAALQRAAQLNAGMQPLYASSAKIAMQHNQMLQQFRAAQQASGRIPPGLLYYLNHNPEQDQIQGQHLGGPGD